MRKFFQLVSYIALFSLCHYSLLNAQGVCGFDGIYQRQLKDQTFRRNINKIDNEIKVKAGNIKAQRLNTTNVSKTLPPANIVNTPDGPVYQIPVVVHVINTGAAIGTAYNPSNVQIIGMIDFLNQVYSATTGVFPGAASGGVNIPIRFALAKRTPDCNPTNGINRVDGTVLPGYADYGVAYPGSTQGASDASVKALSKWPNTAYYNIWIVWRIMNNGSTGILGYAYYPGASSSIDGMVIISSQVNNHSTTMPHEMGHAMSLMHTFEGSVNGACQANNDCTVDGDKVCDTEPSLSMLYNCPADGSINPCTGLALQGVQHNIMNYGTCLDRFTQGQSDRAVAGLLTQRNSLVYSLGAITPDGQIVKPAQIPPDIANPGNNFNAGPANVLLNDLNYSSSGYTVDGNKSYIENLCLTKGAISTANSALSVTTLANAQYCKAWIDFDNSGSFESSELVLDSKGNTGTYIHQGIITNAMLINAVKNTPLRMRIMADIAAIDSPVSQLSYGQTEDFVIVINSALPVLFQSVEAKINNSVLLVEWSTAMEKNNDHFIIEASKDGQNFVNIGEVKSKALNGNSDIQVKYSFNVNIITQNLLELALFLILFITTGVSKTRKVIFLVAIQVVIFSLYIIGLFACNKTAKNGVATNHSSSVYIRIKQVDKDGTIIYSKIVKAIHL